MNSAPANPSKPQDFPTPQALAAEGWKIYESASPFSIPHGPIYQKIDPDGTCRRAFRAGEQHCNAAGIVHGGMLVTFIDALMGITVAHNAQSTALTIRLTTDFLSIARPGDWIEGHSQVSKLTSGIAFVDAEAFVASPAANRPVISAQGLFKLMRRRGFRRKP